MSKTRKLTEEELLFLEETLDRKEDLEISDSGEEIKIVEKPKIKQKKVPAYKNPMHWVVGFILAPVLFSGVFMFLLLRLEIILGAGSLEWLTGSESGKLVEDTASEMGLTWLPQVIEVYENRWLIIGAIFTIFFLLALIVIVYDNFIQPKLSNRRNSKNNNIAKEAD